MTYAGAMFSLSPGLGLLPCLIDLLKIWTWGNRRSNGSPEESESRDTYIELPSFNVLASLLACDDYHQLGDLATNHPSIKLGHDLLDVGFDLIVGRDLEKLSDAMNKRLTESEQGVPSILRPYFLTLQVFSLSLSGYSCRKHTQ